MATTRKLEVVIAGDPGPAKKAFQEVDRAAKRMADGVEDAGDDAGAGLADGIGDGFGSGSGGMLGGIEGILAGPAGVAAIAGTVGIAAGGILASKLAEGFQDSLEMEQTSDKAAAQLGLTGEDATRLGRVAGDLYNDAFGESFEQANEAVAGVVSAFAPLGFTSDETLSRLSEHALNFAKIYDTDVNEAIGRVQILLSTGLVESADEGFDHLFRLMQQLPASVRDEALDAVEEYSQFFAGLGFSGEQAFAMIAAAAPGGRYAIDKIGDSVKEFRIRATDMSTATQEAFSTMGMDAQTMANRILEGGDTAQVAFQDIIDGLLGIQDPATRANTAIALFGTPFEDIAGDGAKVEELLRSLGSDTLPGIEGAASSAGDTVNDNLGTAIDSITTKLSLSSLMNTARTEGFEGVKQQVSEGIGELGALWDEYGPQVKEAFDKVIGIAQEWWDEHGAEVLDKIRVWWDETGSPMLGELLGAGVDAAFAAAWAYLKDSVSDPEWWIDHLVPPGLTDIFSREVADTIGQGLWDGGAWIVEGLSKAWDAGFAWMRESGIPMMWEAATGIMRIPLDVAVAFVGVMANAGKMIVLGIWNGLVGMASWLWEKVTGFVESFVVKPVKAVLDIFSPSGVFEEIGHNVVLGLEEGITDSAPLAAGAAGGLAGSLTEPFGGGGRAAGGGDVIIHVDGSVLTDGRDLAELVRRALNQVSRTKGTPMFTFS